MKDGLFSGLKKPTASAEKVDQRDTSRQSNKDAAEAATIAGRVDFGNLPSEKERLQDIVEGIHFQSSGAHQSKKDKRKADYLDNGTSEGKTTTLKQIPVCVGGPYLCDSDSDVTVPISVVEELETVEESAD